MRTAVRAGASVLMLAGFYVVALVQFFVVLALALGGVYVAQHVLGVRSGGWSAIVLVCVAGIAVLRAMRVEPEPMAGVILHPDMASQLWHTVRTIAAEIGTRAPDEIRIVAEAQAGVSENVKLLGFVGGFRRLSIGLPLIQALSVEQLRGVVAHELGHYSQQHTRAGAVAYQGRIAIEATVGKLGRFNPIGWGFRVYAKLYRLVDNAASRAQEFEADRVAALVVGPEVVAAALREVPVVEDAWDVYFDSCVSAGWNAGYAPADLFGGFGEMVAERQDLMRQLRASVSVDSKSKWDNHPPIAERIAAMADVQPVARAVYDYPANTLLPNVGMVAYQLQQMVVDVGDRTVLPWPEFTEAAITAGQQRSADRFFRALARIIGQSSAGLPELLDLVAAGKLADLTDEFYPNATRREAPTVFAGPMKMIISLAAVRSGVATWQHSWSESATLVDLKGEPVDYAAVARLAVDPKTVPEARSRMAELGISVEQTTVVERTVTGQGASVITAISDVKIDGVDHDVIVLSRGFVLVPVPSKKADTGSDRLERIIGSGPLSVLVERNRFLPYEEIVTLTFVKQVPARVRIDMRGGATVAMDERWGSATMGKGSRDAFVEVLERLAKL